MLAVAGWHQGLEIMRCIDDVSQRPNVCGQWTLQAARCINSETVFAKQRSEGSEVNELERDLNSADSRLGACAPDIPVSELENMRYT